MSKRSGRRGNCDQTGLAGNRGWFFRKLGSKKEGGSQQIEYKLPNLHSRVEPLQRRTLSKKSQEKMLLKSDVGTGVVQSQGKVVIYEHENSQAGKSDALVDIYSSTI